VFFQHGGIASQFVLNPFHRFVEHSTLVPHYLILSTKAEHKFCLSQGEAPRVRTIPMNFHARPKRVKAVELRRKKIALYFTSPFSSYTFRHLVTESSDVERMLINDSILEVAAELGIALDLKLHPVEAANNYTYFKTLKNKHDAKKVRILIGGAGEALMPKYDLFIVDFLPSSVVPEVLKINVPVICWLSPEAAVNGWFLPDLKERCYIVNSKHELSEVISLYRQGKLQSKWRPEFNQEYGGTVLAEEQTNLAKFFEKFQRPSPLS